ncbi:hypothetical protein HK098_007744 [Nowakowskiella sp. JEL0407]|nr:hypothetical protein HK098_007744 [Nowakowskiella sp. JEL0407]
MEMTIRTLLSYIALCMIIPISLVSAALTPKQVRKIPIPHLIDVSITSGGSQFISGELAYQPVIKIWDTKTGNYIRNFTKPELETFGIQSLAFSGDGTKVVGTYYTDKLVIWNAVTGDYIRTLSCGTSIKSVKVNRDASKIVTLEWMQDEISVWDATTGNLLYKLSPPSQSETLYTNDVAISSDGTRIAAPIEQSGNVNIWDAANGAFIRSFANDVFVTRVVFSYDGLQVLTGDNSGAIKLWDTLTGKLIRKFTGHQFWITGLTITQDGKTIASAANDGLKLWDAASGSELYAFNTPAIALAMSGDGSTIISPFQNLTSDATQASYGLVMWDFDSAVATTSATTTTSLSTAKTSTIPTTTSTTQTVTTSKTSTTTSTYKTSTTPANTTTSTTTKIPTTSTTTKPTTITSTLSTTKLSTTSTTSKTTTSTSATKSTTTTSTTKTTTAPTTTTKTTTKTSLTTTKTTTTAKCTSTPIFVNTFNQLNTNDLGGQVGTNGTSTFWIGGGIGAWQPQNNGYLFNNLFIPSATPANQCRSLTQYSAIQMIMVRSDSSLAVPMTIGLELGCLSRERKILATVNVDGTARNFPVSLAGVNLSSVKNIVFSWTGSVRPTILMDNIADKHVGHERQLYTNFTKPEFSPWWLQYLSISSDGTRVVGSNGAFSGMIMIWNANTGEYLNTIPAGDVIKRVNLNKDGTLVAAVDLYVDIIKVWNAVTGSLLYTIQEPYLTTFTSDVVFSSDSKFIAAPYKEQGKIYIWNATNKAVVRVISASTERVSRVAFSGDGLKLLSGDMTGVIKLWDVATGNLIRTFTGHQETITSLAISQNGKRIASSSFDGVKYWDATTGIEIYGSKLFSSSVAMSTDGLTIVSSFINMNAVPYSFGIYVWDYNPVTITTTTFKSTTTTTKTTSTPVSTKTSTVTTTTTTPINSTSTTTKTTTTPTKTKSTTTTTTTSKTTANPTTSSTTTKKTTTTTTKTTTTAKCTSTPLLVNSFSQLSTNDLGGAVGTNGTGTYWIGSGIGAWQPQNNGYFYSNFFTPSTPLTNQCRSLTQYSGIQLIMVRSDSPISTMVTIGVEVGCETRDVKKLATVSVDGVTRGYKVSLAGVGLGSVKRIVLSWTGSVRPTILMDNIAFVCM